MWLEVVVREAEGGEVFTNTAPIGLEPLGHDGKPTMPWNAATFGTDTRIGPKEHKQWEFPLPEKSTIVLDVRASVYYRSISELAARAAGIPQPSAAIEIALDRLRLYPDGHFERTPVN
jgi:hypothetical protein